MNRWVLIWSLALLPLGFSACTKQGETLAKKASVGPAHEDSNGYYTCSMHPQVHQHDPGNCPICGMALVKVSGAKKPESNGSEIEADASAIDLTTRQLSLAGIGTYTVQRKDMSFALPVSGRMTSSRQIAFQVFEMDLQIVKSGLAFSGYAASSPNEQLNGRIVSVDNLLDPSSRTVRVTGTLNEPPRKAIVEGAFYGEIISVEKAQLAVPEDAVLHTGTTALVYLKSPDKRLKPIPVALGRKARDEYQILSGLKEGDTISSGPNFLIDSESKIRGGDDKTHH